MKGEFGFRREWLFECACMYSGVMGWHRAWSLGVRDGMIFDISFIRWYLGIYVRALSRHDMYNSMD